MFPQFARSRNLFAIALGQRLNNIDSDLGKIIDTMKNLKREVNENADALDKLRKDKWSFPSTSTAPPTN